MGGKRKSNNPDGRPSMDRAAVSVVVSGSPGLMARAAVAASGEGVSVREWWRRAALERLCEHGGGETRYGVKLPCAQCYDSDEVYLEPAGIASGPTIALARERGANQPARVWLRRVLTPRGLEWQEEKTEGRVGDRR